MLFPPGIPISKRIFDLVATTLGLLLISPILIILAALVTLFLGMPVIFSQERPGYKGRPFFIHKFRTMTDVRDADGNLLPDAVRLTSLGRVMRALSLDELPELFDVLRGEMSLVGLPVDLPVSGTVTSAEFNGSATYLGPRGVTGLVQISMRDGLTSDEIERYMLYYAKNQSMILDLEILVKSLQRDRRG